MLSKLMQCACRWWVKTKVCCIFPWLVMYNRISVGLWRTNIGQVDRVKRKFIMGNLPFTCATKKMLFTVLISVLILHLVYCIRIDSETCWVVSTQIWVRYGQTQMLGLSIFDTNLGSNNPALFKLVEIKKKVISWLNLKKWRNPLP